MRSGVDCHWKGQVVGTVERGPVVIHSRGQTISSLVLIEGITLGAGEEVDEVAGGAGGMGVDGIGEVGDRASEGQAAGVYGVGFTAGCRAGKGARGGTRGMGNKVSLDKELMEVGRVTEGDRGGARKKVASGGISVISSIPGKSFHFPFP